jgi:tryptophanyl-tRNA synthetase
VEEMEGRPDIANLIGIYAALSERSEVDIMKEHGGGQFGPFKSALADVAVEALRPVTELMNRYLAAPDEIDAILSKAGDDAAAIADPIVADVRRIIGFRGA